ncbi:hypothetical protein NQZ68_022293 [Dissostichus eleginoides]|uniref:Anti-sigma F factor n=1 Tax=Dissostichus eleginoides TaxID=100907 RepID=A0AAD9CIB9_DISEL|nr:hypothetical protein NQZ68_022293 [Dissostichus eleginoides]KAK1900149.1 Anti-sigma F factor [Dissostichus eleginoides]
MYNNNSTNGSNETELHDIRLISNSRNTGKREGYEEGGAGVGGDEEQREEEELGKELMKSGGRRMCWRDVMRSEERCMRDEELREEEMLGKEVMKSRESRGNRGRKWQEKKEEVVFG